MDATTHDDVPAEQPATDGSRTAVEVGWALIGVGALLGLVLGRASAASVAVRSLAALVLLVALVVSLRAHRRGPAAGAVAGLVVAGVTITAALT